MKTIAVLACLLFVLPSPAAPLTWTVNTPLTWTADAPRADCLCSLGEPCSCGSDCRCSGMKKSAPRRTVPVRRRTVRVRSHYPTQAVLPVPVHQAMTPAFVPVVRPAFRPMMGGFGGGMMRGGGMSGGCAGGG